LLAAHRYRKENDFVLDSFSDLKKKINLKIKRLYNIWFESIDVVTGKSS
jgi:hypothetical protein